MPTLFTRDIPAVVTKLRQAVKATFGVDGTFDDDRKRLKVPVTGSGVPNDTTMIVALNMPELVTIIAVCPARNVKRDRIDDALRYVCHVNAALADGCVELDARDGEVRLRRAYVSSSNIDRSVGVIMDVLKRLHVGARHVFSDVGRLNEYGGSNRQQFCVGLARSTVTAVFKDSDGQSKAEALAAAKRF